MDGATTRSARAEPLAQKTTALGRGLRVRDDPLYVGQLQVARGDHAMVDRVHDLGDDLHVGGVERERVERDRDAPLERVLDRDDAAVDLARRGPP